MSSLGALFPDSDDEDGHAFAETYETSEALLGGLRLQVRQYTFHITNANQIWPGTYALAEYIRTHLDAFRSKAVLELGAATGVLSVYLHKVLDGSDAPKIYTSDIDDDGQVEENIRFNYAANNIPIPAEFPHIAHTWGREWTHPQRFDVVVASDILLYVSAYADLVKSVAFLFASRGASVFFMSWKRRIADSSIFFNMMVAEGFLCTRYSEDQCIYIFTRPGAGLGSSATTDRLS